MPRSVKESEDELEMKSAGRRTRAIGSTAIVDSPLRRSVRKRQTISQGGSSPDSIVSDVAAPPARSTRRRSAAIDHSMTENTISLRSRKNSTTSDTSEFTDNDNFGDGKKRITTRSTATTPPIETPTKTRLRRTSRAGSETKTMSPVRTTRRTRASSIDLEDVNVQSTPRKRMSTLPNELSVINEDGVLKESQQNNRSDTEITNVSNDSSLNSVKSPMSRPNANRNEVNVQMEIEETSTEVLEQLNNDVFESATNNSLTTPTKSKTDLELNNKILPELDFPKVVLHKADIPTLKSPETKENGESYKIVVKKQSKSIIPRRNSVNNTSDTIIQVEKRLNKTIDDFSWMTNEIQSFSTIPPSASDLSTLKQPETTINNTSFNDQDVLSMANDSQDKTIALDSPFGQKLAEKIKNVSEDFQEKDSVVEVDTTVENVVFDNTKDFNNSIDMNLNKRKSFTVNEDHNCDSAKIHVCENIVEDSHESLSLSKENTDENVKSNDLSVEIVETENCESSKNTAGGSYTNIPEIRRLSIVQTRENNQGNEEMNATKRRSSSRESISTSRLSQTRKSQSKIDNDRKECNVDGSDDIETDVENLFQDISAEEWNAQQTESSENDNESNEGNLKHEDMNYENVLSSNKESLNKNNSITEEITNAIDNNSNETNNDFTNNNSRKSLNIESIKSNSDSKLKRRTIERMDTTKSCTEYESISSDNNIIDISQDKSVDRNKTECSIKSPETLKQSLIEQTHDEIPEEHLMDEEINENETSATNENFHDTSMNSNDTSDSNSNSIDSDIANELNLKGDSISLYSDDNVPGDECRASETETSEDDEDGADDMADFIVDDDEDVEEAESDEDVEEAESDEDVEEEESDKEGNSENNASIIKSSIQEVHEADESNDETGISLKIKLGTVNSSSSDENECDMEQNRSPNVMKTNISRKYKSKNRDSIASIDASTPRIRRRLSGSTVATPQELPSIEITADLKTLNQSQSKVGPIYESGNSRDAPTKPVHVSDKENTYAKLSYAKTQKNMDYSRQSQLKRMNDTSRHSMNTAPTVSPEVTYLMKEKLNESLPPLKLQRRSLKASDTLASVHELTPKNKKERVEVRDDVVIGKSHKKGSKKLSDLSSSAMETDDQLHVMKENEGIKNSAIIKKNKKKHKLLTKKEKDFVKSVEISSLSKKSSVKRLSADVLENLPDVPIKKRRKIEQAHVHSRTLFDSINPQSTNSSAKNISHAPTSTCNSTTNFKVLSLKSTLAKLQNLPNGQKKMKKRRQLELLFVPSTYSSTTHFDVVSLKKRMKVRSKKTAAAFSFRERMLARNKHRPVSAYFMYQQKEEASRNTQH